MGTAWKVEGGLGGGEGEVPFVPVGDWIRLLSCGGEVVLASVRGREIPRGAGVGVVFFVSSDWEGCR